MNPRDPPSIEESNREIAAQIETLHDAGRRIEELTAGEVDSVADRDGNTYLLRPAQQQILRAHSLQRAAILNALPAQVAMLDAHGVIVSVNASWEQLELPGAFAGAAFVVGADYVAICERAEGRDATRVAEITEGLRAVLAGSMDKFSIEYDCASIDGERSFDLRVTTLTKDAPGEIAVMHVDVTDVRSLERGLRESDLRFGQMAESIGDVFYLGDADGRRVLYASPAYEDIWARSRESLYANPSSWGEAIHPEDRGLAWRAIQKCEAEGASTAEYRIVRPDGSVRWIETRGFWIDPQNGVAARIGGVAKDITDRRKVEDELRESGRRYSEMLGNIQLAATMLDERARITYCNDYLLDLTGWKREEVIGRNWFDMFAPPEAGDMRPVFAQFMAGDENGRYRENEIVTRSGARRMIRWNNTLLRSGNGEVIGSASIGEDVTAQREAMERLAYLNRVLGVLSGINALIVRVGQRDELFEETCRISHEVGGFPMALICIVQPATGKAVPVASSGIDDALMASIREMLDSRDPRITGSTMVERALREQHAVVSNDAQQDAQVLLKATYLDYGVRSMAVLPLVVADVAVGVLALYANERGFFHADEMKLLTELAGDISYAIDHLEKTDRLDYLAYYDEITGLANRRLFLERVGQFVRSATVSGHKLAVGLIDMERFKDINDSHGHAAGDALLKQVAQWLSSNLLDASLVARVGADHFAIVFPDVREDGNLDRLIDLKMATLMNQPFRIDGNELRVAFKGGVALFPDNGSSPEELFRNAEAALKKAKAHGDRYLFFTQAMNKSAAGRLTLANQLRRALENEEFVLHYQPKTNLVTRKLCGAEALIRWNDPHTGLVPPNRFIPLLEETGLIQDVGRWALRKALQDFVRWRREGRAPGRIAVNVSPLQLRHRGFVDDIRQVIGIESGAEAGLELEITEGVIMEDVKHSIATLQAIRALGVTFAIDDFGTGFSSLSYLAKLPVDSLKIDRSFVVSMSDGPQDLALVSTIIGLAHALDLIVVAEGVETEEQSSLLRLLRCDQMQGFLVSRAVDAADFEARFLSPAGTGLPPT